MQKPCSPVQQSNAKKACDGRVNVYSWVMARPIEPTPSLSGADADRLIRDLADVCPPEEARARMAQARTARAAMMESAEPEPLNPAPAVTTPNKR